MKYYELYKMYVYKTIEGIVNVWDPRGLIQAGAPFDEYSGEIEALLELLEYSMEPVEVRELVRDVFVKHLELDPQVLEDSDEFEDAVERIFTEMQYFQHYLFGEMSGIKTLS